MALQKLVTIYTGPGLGNPALNVLRMPTVDGTIKETVVDFPSVTVGDALFNITMDGVEIVLSSDLTVADGNERVTVSGLSLAMATGKVLALNLLSPLPAGLPDPPWSWIVTYDDGVAAAASSSGGGGMGEDGADGESWMIPGPQGPAGVAGTTGTVGAMGPPGFGFDGGDGDVILIPGPQGPQGTAGAPGATGATLPGLPGPQGADGQDGETFMIPGPAGPSGAPGTGGGITYTEITGTSQSASVNNGYITNNASLVTVTLPPSAAVGDIVSVRGSGAGGWKIAQNASQVIKWTAGSVAGATETTTGTGGSVSSNDRYDSIELQCIGANNTWLVANAKGAGFSLV